MIHPTLHSNARFSWISVTAILFLLAVAIRTNAGVSLGSIATNAAEAEQQRTIQFYDAELSLQRKLEVGKERYERRQADRAKAIEAMAAEPATGQKTVIIQSVTAPYVNKMGADTLSWTLLGVAALGLGFIVGLRYYRSRQDW